MNEMRSPILQVWTESRDMFLKMILLIWDFGDTESFVVAA